jgi:clan AA aspartic protease
MIKYSFKRFDWKPTTSKNMGEVKAYIELLNNHDVVEAAKHNIGEDEIRRISIEAMVDTGSFYPCINEDIQEVLQLRVIEKRRFQLADGGIVTCDLVGPVDIRFENRSACCNAIVLPGGADPLLGLLPLEEMDVAIDPKGMRLIINPNYPGYAHIRM